MEETKLVLKQVADYPRCRMYRQFIHGLIANKNLRVGGSSSLYYYTVLSCYANFKTFYHRVKSVTYMPLTLITLGKTLEARARPPMPSQN